MYTSVYVCVIYIYGLDGYPRIYRVVIIIVIIIIYIVYEYITYILFSFGRNLLVVSPGCRFYIRLIVPSTVFVFEG